MLRWYWYMNSSLTPCWAVLDFWKINLEKSSSTNWIFSLFRTGFLMPVQLQSTDQHGVIMIMCLKIVLHTFKRINDSSNLSETKIRSIWFSSSRILFDTACWSLSFSLLKPRSHKLSPTSKWARKMRKWKNIV